jgi:carboxymethylenebutenolidase
MQTHWIELAVGDTTMLSYVAEPASPPKAGIIIIQEIFGVNEPMRKLTELVASIGYLGVAPALFHRTDPKFEAEYNAGGFAKGQAAAAEVTLESASADLEAAATYVRERLGRDAKIATWGFCFGGSIAMLSATLPGIDAAVSFYGGQIARSPHPSRPPIVTLAPEVKAPLFFAFGGLDQHIPAEDWAVIRSALDEQKKPYEFHVLPEEDHGFFRQGPGGNKGSAENWPLVQAFLAEHLG